MKTLPELLREADPLANEPRPMVDDHRVSRQTIVAALSPVERVPHRTIRLAAVIALALIPLVVIGGRWLPLTVNVAAAVRFEARLAEESPAPGLQEVAVPGSNRKIYLHQEVVVANSDIAEARVVPGATAVMFNVAITFTDEGAQKMLRASRNHIGKPIAILLDGEVTMAPTVRSPISGSAMITGNYTKAEADRIVAGIK